MIHNNSTAFTTNSSDDITSTLQNFFKVVTTEEMLVSENGSTRYADLFSTTSTTPSTAGLDFDEETSRLLYAADVIDYLSFVCACVGFLFNLSNIFIITISNLYKNIMYKLFISQAAANAIYALSDGLVRASFYFLKGDADLIIRFITNNLLHIGSMICALTYTLISLELYYKVILPFKHRGMGNTFNVALIFIWVIPIIVTGSYRIGIILSNMEPNETFLMTFSRLQDNTLAYINTGLALVCIIVIVYLNVDSLRAVCRSLRGKAREAKGTKKSTITIVAMVTTYFIFYLPNWIVGILFELEFKSKISILPVMTMGQMVFVNVFLSSLKVMNTIADPVIYVVRINRIRETYKRLRMKLKCCSQELECPVVARRTLIRGGQGSIPTGNTDESP